MRTLGATVPGRSWPGSIPGSAMWADITTFTPAAIALRKGTSSTESSRDQVEGITGSDRWESVPVSPCPGKCFAVASTPLSCSPRTSAATIRPTAAGSSPNERVLMMGLSGLLLTSATGANARWMPTARASSAVMRPISYAALSLPDAATPILGGSGVPPLKRMLVPPSRSDATRSGSPERPCSRLSFAAMSSGEPTDTMRPPTWSESIHASTRSNASASYAA